MEQNLQLIEAYLNGELDSEQSLAFEQRLQEDAELNEAFKRERSMRAFLVKENSKDKVLAQLEGLGKKHFDEAAVPEAPVVDINRSRIWRGLAVAAAVALLIVAVRFFFIQPSLYEQYAQHTPISLVEKSDNIPVASAAEAAFNRADYPTAYRLLGQYLQADPTNKRALLAQGVSALELQRYEASANIFNQLYQDNNQSFRNAGAWYLALQNVRQQQFSEAIPYLSAIPATDTFYYPKAQQLLEDLKNQ